MSSTGGAYLYGGMAINNYLSDALTLGKAKSMKNDEDEGGGSNSSEMRNMVKSPGDVFSTEAFLYFNNNINSNAGKNQTASKA